MAEKYSLIIIGAGITGLSTGLAWTKLYNANDKPVLIVEKHSVPGGCVTTFVRNGYHFDTVQIVPDVSDLLDFFGVDINLQKFDQHLAKLFLADPAKKSVRIFPIAFSKDSFVEYLLQHYPNDSKSQKA